MPSTIVLSNIDVYLEDSRSPSAGGYIPPLVLAPQFGFVPQRLNRGFPEIRDVSDKRPSQNGTFDFTEFFGARAITLEVSVATELQDNPSITDEILEDSLRKWMLPNVRAYLYVKPKDEILYRRALVRPANVGSQLNFVTNAGFRTVSMSWRGVDGVFEDAALSTNNLEVSSTTEAGRTYDQTYDKTYAASSVIGAKIIRNEGNAPSFPVISVYGACTQPRIENITTGKKLEFLAAYTVNSGEYLVIDFAEGTVYLNGDSTNSRYDKIDFAGGISEWWDLQPGDNFLRFYPLSSSPPSTALIEWRSKFI